jgi:hypothetical protein
MRVTRNPALSAMQPRSNITGSAKELATFIEVSPEQHRKIAQLICSIGDSMGKEGITLLRDYVQAVSKGDMVDFNKRWASKKVPLSIMSDLLALSQEMEADTREKLDALILKAKKGAVELGKHALNKALLLLV